MWLMFARAPRPDAQVWPGRRALAVVDAVAWPGACALFLVGQSLAQGVATHVVLAGCMVAALRRVHRALARNHRYHFTAWRWGRWLAMALCFGFALKLTAVVSA
jgi:hypothetical protein